jgi:ADP-ribose pyrophosphatase YjhB (NUDIX family)/multidrug transporter EmrE-like cation transporter
LGDAYMGWLVLILLAVGPTVGGFGLYTVSLNYLPASVANIIATLEPAMTSVLAFILLGERFTTPQWIGSFLIVAGVIVLRLEETPSAPSPKPAESEVSQRIRYQGAVLQGSRILLIRHQEHASGRDYWVIPGGSRIAGESEEACVARELKEETSLEVAVERLLLDDCFESRFGSHHHKTYLCNLISGQASPGYEPEIEASQHYAIVEVGWFDLHDKASWGQKIASDPITFTLMNKLRLALGFSAAQAGAIPGNDIDTPIHLG